MAVKIAGAVQGVGFRPWVYRLAVEHGLTGWVANNPEGLELEVEGPSFALRDFLFKLKKQPPPHARVESFHSSFLGAQGSSRFEIVPSREKGPREVWVLPDLASCPECLREVFDPSDRRYRYPFTNCTHCGPRYSFIESLPYDRANTSMRTFQMCDACQAEYDDPMHRRHHAQPNACPECGPRMELWGADGRLLSLRDAALRFATQVLEDGGIVAVKGLGGFHLLADAANENAVKKLRLRKHRDEKPFAVMMAGVGVVRAHCRVSDLEERLLGSSEAPIVLLEKKREISLALEVAPDNPYLGVLLPYTPLHHLLVSDFGAPLVATSGNRSEEPIVTDEFEALQRLKDIADFFLVHNRPIARPVEDSVVCAVAGRELVLRRARGLAPFPVEIPEGKTTLAVGAHLKNTVAQGQGRWGFVSPHIGSLDTQAAASAFKDAVGTIPHLYGQNAEEVVCDLHPDYASTQFAQRTGLPLLRVQHHYAHALACLAENGHEGPALAVIWDGSGLGTDGTLWGGEFLDILPGGFRRVAHWRTFALPGGEVAAREPRRSAAGMLWEIFGADLADEMTAGVFHAEEWRILFSMLERKVQTPRTSSVGRLFDAVASLIRQRQVVSYEGQAAMELEFLLQDIAGSGSYPLGLEDAASGSEVRWIVDWEPMIRAILEDRKKNVRAAEMALKFHNTLVDAIAEIASCARRCTIALGGGCFQNRYLLERTISRLRHDGFEPLWPKQIPPNDGGISFGQLVASRRVPTFGRP